MSSESKDIVEQKEQKKVWIVQSTNEGVNFPTRAFDDEKLVDAFILDMCRAHMTHEVRALKNCKTFCVPESVLPIEMRKKKRGVLCEFDFDEFSKVEPYIVRSGCEVEFNGGMRFFSDNVFESRYVIKLLQDMASSPEVTDENIVAWMNVKSRKLVRCEHVIVNDDWKRPGQASSGSWILAKDL